MGEAEVPPTTSFALLRKPDSREATGASQWCTPTGARIPRTQASLAASWSAYGSPMREQERQTPESKYAQCTARSLVG